MVIAKNLYRGYKESDDVNKWFSKVLGVEVMVLRAEKDRYLTMNRYRLPRATESDRRAGFITDGALHLINLQSVKRLKSWIKEKHSDKSKEVCVEPRTFRPNIVIDYKSPFVED